jgi:predicted GNAT family N-acyltransferase
VHPNIHFGKTQKEIQDFLNSFGFSFVENDYSILGNKEIDLYDCNKKIAIEYCGLFWHTDLSPNPRDKNYHYDKHNKCLEKDIHLITIFEDEWVNRNYQCKNVLKSILGIYDLRVYARKCTIVKLDKKEFNYFCDEYHLQGKNTLGQIFYGLKHENTLVAAMSFGSHHRNNHDLVLDRFCCKGDVQVVGGASRLFKACLTEAKTLGFQKVISWSDNRWRQGTVYEQLGFVLEEELVPDYSYVYLKNTKNKRISKQSMQKKNTNCPPDMTEKEWATINGFGRIYDCGKKRWVHNIV